MVRLALLGGVAVLAGATAAAAATVTWTAGATSTSWALGSNWDTGVAPVAGDDVVICADGTFDPTNNSAYTGIALNSLTLNNSLGFNNSVTLSSALQVGAGGVSNMIPASGNLSLNEVNLTADQTWGGTRTIFVGGAITGAKMNFNGSGIRFDANSPAWSSGLDVRSSVGMGGGFAAGTTFTPWGTGTLTLINQNSATLAATSPLLGLASAAGNASVATANTLANAIVLSDPSTGNFTINQTQDTGGANAHFYILSGDITGAVNASRTLSFNNSALTPATNTATFILTGANTYAAANIIGSNTTLQIGNGGTTGTLGTNTGSIANAGTLAFNRSDAVAVANIISGAGAVQQLGTGTLTLSGVNTFSGGLTIKAGTVSLGTTVAAGGSGTITIGDTGGSAAATLNLGGIGVASAVYTNAIALGTSSGPLTLASTTSNSTVRGGVTGTNNLILANIRGGTGGSMTIETANVDFTGTLTNGGALVGGSTLGTTTISSQNTNKVTGVIQNSTASTLILSGANTYTGATTITGGTLSVGTIGDGGVRANGLPLFAHSHHFT